MSHSKRVGVILLVASFASLAGAAGLVSIARADTPPPWPTTSKCVSVYPLIRCTLVRPTGLTVGGTVRASLWPNSPVVKGGRANLFVTVECDGTVRLHVRKLVAPTGYFETRQIHPALPGVFAGVRRCHIEIRGKVIKNPTGSKSVLLHMSATPFYAG